METTETSIFEELQNERPLEFAATGLRFVNFMIDLIVAYALVIGVYIMLRIIVPSFIIFLQSESIGTTLLNQLLSIALFVATYTIIEGGSKGKTLGKLLTRTRAVKEDGSAITWRDAFIRSISRFVPFEALSGFSGYPWHDKWSKTCVIKEHKMI